MMTPFNTENLARLETKIDYVFQDKTLLLHALTHSSAGADYNYERLEFLGDRILGLVVSEILYEKFPTEQEGDLAKRLASLVQGTWLAKMALHIDLGDFMHFSDAERGAGGYENENILADGMEALLGALYLDSGLPICRKFIETLWGDAFYELKKPPQHPKTALQEWAQGNGLPLPEYTITQQSGPDHAPVFEVEVQVQGYAPISATGKSRQAAEKEVAALFLTKQKV